MHVREYVDATYALLMDGADIHVLLQKLTATLERKGYSRMYLRILKGLHTKLEQHDTDSRARVVVGRQSDVDTLAKPIRESIETLGTALATPHIEVDPTVIGGFRTTVGARTIDKTYKRQLLALYRSLTD